MPHATEQQGGCGGVAREGTLEGNCHLQLRLKGWDVECYSGVFFVAGTIMTFFHSEVCLIVKFFSHFLIRMGSFL